MYCYTFQDWITIRGQSTTVSPITQSEYRWFDLTPFQDLVAWLEVKEVTTNPNIALAYQTSPTKDDSLFVALTTAVTLSTSPSVQVTPMLAATVSNPLARWLRWQITASSGSPWDATFRILVAANSPGFQPPGK